MLRKQKELYTKMGLVIVAGVVIAAGLFFNAGQRIILTNSEGQQVLKRSEKGSSGVTEDLLASIGREKEEITLTIKGQHYAKEEQQELLERTALLLEEMVLGGNESLTEVRENMRLPTLMSETGVRITWQIDNYEVMNLQGVIRPEKIPPEGTIVTLQALLMYEEERLLYEFYAHLYPPSLTPEERLRKELEKALQETEESTREQEWLLLPKEQDGVAVVWDYAKDYSVWGVAFLGVVAAGLLYLGEKQKKQEYKKKRERQLFLDYPQLIDKFTLYIGAGMTPRTAWFKMAEEYLGQREERGERFVYEEMLHTMYEIQGGGFEGECYERFGRRCNLPSYRKFGALLSQNLRKGTKGLAQLLKNEAELAFEERKNLAKKLGEEAATKLLLPMFLMLGIVLIIVVIPAFLTIQI